MSGYMCSARAYGTGKTFRGSPCSKPVKVERGGMHYCTFHDPERVSARRAARIAEMDARATARRAAMDAEQARNNEIARRAECYPELLGAAETAKAAIGKLKGKRITREMEIAFGQLQQAIAKATGAQP